VTSTSATAVGTGPADSVEMKTSYVSRRLAGVTWPRQRIRAARPGTGSNRQPSRSMVKPQAAR
jgi:hypothetical protein